MFAKLKKLLTPSFSFIIAIFFILLVYIFYKYTSLYEFFFNNPFGYIAILFFIGFFYYLNKWLGIFMGFVLGLLFILSRPINFFVEEGKKEGFKWSRETIKEFDRFQNTYNPNLIFDVDLLQQQASQKEVDILLETGYWPWSPDTKKLFEENVQNNTMIKTSPEGAMELARTIYNDRITNEMLSWNEPEGQLLLAGIYVDNSANHVTSGYGAGSYGINSGLISPNKDLIKCGKSKKTGKLVMQRTENLGNDGIFGAHVKKVTDIPDGEIPNAIKGFEFIKGPCNPCVAIEETPQYTCPFTLDKKEKKVSSIWEKLWNIRG